MASTVYRRQSMAQLYEKLRAQDDDDDMAWLAQYSPDDKFDEPYVPPTLCPPSLSTITSVSPASSYSSASPISDPGFDSEFSDDHLDSDSDSDDVDPDPLSFDLSCTASSPSLCSPLIFQPHDLAPVTEPLDAPHTPLIKGVSPPPSGSTPLSIESDSSPVLVPSIALRRAARSVVQSPARYRSPILPRDSNEDVYSESDGNGSEDEYVPSPTLGSRKRNRSVRSASSSVASSSQKRTAQSVPRKRPRSSPHPRNTQTTPGTVSGIPTQKSNPWACPYCKWVQRNHRTPDLKRHIRTHTRLQRPARWVCCGVPVKDAGDYKIPADAEPYVWGGEEMIGGCCKEFSRRDALKRHLDNDHISCIGNFTAFASISEDDI